MTRPLAVTWYRVEAIVRGNANGLRTEMTARAWLSKSVTSVTSIV